MIYVIIQGDTIVNRVVCNDSTFAIAQGWIQNDAWQIGWIRDGEAFVPPPEPEPE